MLRAFNRVTNNLSVELNSTSYDNINLRIVPASVIKDMVELVYYLVVRWRALNIASNQKTCANFVTCMFRFTILGLRHTMKIFYSNNWWLYIVMSESSNILHRFLSDSVLPSACSFKCSKGKTCLWLWQYSRVSSFQLSI